MARSQRAGDEVASARRPMIAWAPTEVQCAPGRFLRTSTMALPVASTVQLPMGMFAARAVA